jgi:hypothetical protein
MQRLLNTSLASSLAPRWRSFTTTAAKPLLCNSALSRASALASLPLQSARRCISTTPKHVSGGSQPRLSAKPAVAPMQKRNSDVEGAGIAVPVIDLSGYFSGSQAAKMAVAKQIGEVKPEPTQSVAQGRVRADTPCVDGVCRRVSASVL